MNRPEPEGLGRAAPAPSATGLDNQAQQQGLPPSLVIPGVGPSPLLLKSLPSLTRTPSASGILDALTLLSSPRSSPGGPRSKSPLPARPTSSPRNNAATTTISSSSTAVPVLPSYLSPTTSSMLRSPRQIAALPDKLVITSPSSPFALTLSSSPSLSRSLTASPMIGDLHLIKEEENEDQSESGRSRQSSAAIASSTSGTSSSDSRSNSDSTNSSSSDVVVVSSGTRSRSSSRSSSPVSQQTFLLFEIGGEAAAAAAAAAAGNSPFPHQPQLATADYFKENPQAQSSDPVFDRLYARRKPTDRSLEPEPERLTAEHTFHPIILPSQHTEGAGEAPPVFDRLYAIRKPTDRSAEVEQERLTPEHTFNPVILPQKEGKEGKEGKLVFERLYGQRKERDEWIQKASAVKAKQEVAGLTFIPQLVLTEDYNHDLEHRRDPSSPASSLPSSSSSSSSSPTGGVHDRLYHGLEKKNEYFKKAQAKKKQLDLVDCTFLPEILETATAKKAAEKGLVAEVGGEVEEEGKKEEMVGGVVLEEGGKEGVKKKQEKPKNVWDRLYKSQATLTGKKERQRQEFEARLTFQPALETASAAAAASAEGGKQGGVQGQGRRSRTSSQESTVSSVSSIGASSASSSNSKKDPHVRLYAEGKDRLRRAEERCAKPLPGCTFQPHFVTEKATAATAAATAATSAEKKAGLTRAEALYLHGKEKGKRVLEKDRATRPSAPKTDAEECTFQPQVNWKK